MILLLGGTQDVFMLASAFTTTFPRTMQVVITTSSFEADLLRQQGGCVVLQETMDTGQLARFIQQKGVRVLVDATHPFEVHVKEAAKKASGITHIPYLRYERPSAPVEPGNGVWFVADIAAAAQTAARLGKKIFSAIGVSQLRALLQALPPEKRVTAQVLPSDENLRRCFQLGLTPEQIVALNDPVNQTLNVALFRFFHADVVIARDSGTVEGTTEKVAAARECRIPLILIRRPQIYPEPQSMAEIIRSMRGILTNLE